MPSNSQSVRDPATILWAVAANRINLARFDSMILHLAFVWLFSSRVGGWRSLALRLPGVCDQASRPFLTAE